MFNNFAIPTKKVNAKGFVLKFSKSADSVKIFS